MHMFRRRNIFLLSVLILLSIIYHVLSFLKFDTIHFPSRRRHSHAPLFLASSAHAHRPRMGSEAAHALPPPQEEEQLVQDRPVLTTHSGVNPNPPSLAVLTTHSGVANSVVNIGLLTKACWASQAGYHYYHDTTDYSGGRSSSRSPLRVHRAFEERRAGRSLQEMFRALELRGGTRASAWNRIPALLRLITGDQSMALHLGDSTLFPTNGNPLNLALWSLTPSLASDPLLPGAGRARDDATRRPAVHQEHVHQGHHRSRSDGSSSSRSDGSSSSRRAVHSVSSKPLDGSVSRSGGDPRLPRSLHRKVQSDDMQANDGGRIRASIGAPRYDWILYLDSDVAIANLSVRIEQFLHHKAFRTTWDVVFVDAQKGPNTGSFLVRGNGRGAAFLRRWWDLALELGPKNALSLQQALQSVQLNDQAVLWDMLIREAKEHIFKQQESQNDDLFANEVISLHVGPTGLTVPESLVSCNATPVKQIFNGPDWGSSMLCFQFQMEKASRQRGDRSSTSIGLWDPTLSPAGFAFFYNDSAARFVWPADELYAPGGLAIHTHKREVLLELVQLNDILSGRLRCRRDTKSDDLRRDDLFHAVDIR